MSQEKPKLIMKYVVLKLDDTLDLNRLRYYVNTTDKTFITVRDFAENLLDCIVEIYQDRGVGNGGVKQ